MMDTTQPTADAATRLASDELRWRCDPDGLGFETTSEIAPLEQMIGQTRALSALELGLLQTAEGYNVYVAGPSGSGRMSTVRTLVDRVAASRAAPPDWCYARNFADPYQPRAICVPTGRGAELARDIERLVNACRREIRRAFESEDYARRRSIIVRGFDQRRDAIIDALRPQAERLGFVVDLVPTGIALIPALSPGVPMTPEGFSLLPEEKKHEIQAKSQQLQERVTEALGALRRLEREAHDALRVADQDTALAAIAGVFEGVRAKWAGQPDVLRHLDGIQEDLIDHLDEFRSLVAQDAPAAMLHASQRRYGVNVVVPNVPSSGAPVIFEPNPTYYNLLGRIDHEIREGGSYTDSALIKPGSLHRANGGFLIVQARDLLGNPFAWDALKRALRDRQIRVENLNEQLAILPMMSLKPEPIPLSVKVILVGDPLTHRLLFRLDQDFPRLFKVKAEFSPVMDRTHELIGAYAAFIAARVREHGLLPFSKEAVARIIEHAARLVEDQRRLSARFDTIADIVIEADGRARQAGASQVGVVHVDEALAARDYRLSLLEEEVQRMIADGTVAIDASSRVIGQINGLSVIQLEDYAFARPTRITARTGMGAEGVVDVQREVKLSGPTHSKGVMTLSGYLIGTYASTYPLAFSGRIAFEQVYDEIDGDSASSAELYALLSSLAQLPIRQEVAVTGSVNQLGEIQAVGGVTTKIEGFFAVCKARGLTGTQGVIIPRANVRHLMLKPEVVDAVSRGEFHVWAVETIDQGIEILTGVPAGENRGAGFPPETVHGRVSARLASLAEGLRAYGGARSVLPNGDVRSPGREARASDNAGMARVVL